MNALLPSAWDAAQRADDRQFIARVRSAEMAELEALWRIYRGITDENHVHAWRQALVSRWIRKRGER